MNEFNEWIVLWMNIVHNAFLFSLKMNWALIPGVRVGVGVSVSVSVSVGVAQTLLLFEKSKSKSKSNPAHDIIGVINSLNGLKVFQTK